MATVEYWRGDQQGWKPGGKAGRELVYGSSSCSEEASSAATNFLG